MSLSSLLDYIGQQRELSGIQDWASKQSGGLDPALVDLAQNAPRTFAQIFPKIAVDQMTQQKEAKAARDYFGVGQPDADGITWNKPDASALARMQGLGQDVPVPQTLPDQNAPAVTNYDPQSRFDLTPEQTALLAIQNAQKAQGQAAQARKVSALGALAPSLQSAAAQQLPFGGMSGVGGQNDLENMSGPEVLKNVDAGTAAQVLQLVSGRAPYPTQAALRNPQVNAIMKLANLYDPTFDAATYQTRKAIQTSFGSGQDAKNIAALNTAMSHINALKKSYDALGNTDYPSYNKLANYLGEQLGNEKIQKNLSNVETNAEAVAHELASVFRSSGMSESEINSWKEKIDPNAPPSSSGSVINSALDLMQGRMGALADKWNSVPHVGEDKKGPDLLSTDARNAYNEIKGIKDPQDNTPQKHGSALGQIAPSIQGVTPEMARAELARRRGK